MEVTVTLTVNAGVCVSLCGVRIWIDALHTRPVPGFSTMTAEQVDAVLRHEAFASPDAVLCTHCHGDHFSPEPMRRAQALWQDTPFYLPEPFLPSQRTLLGEGGSFAVGAVTVRYFRLPHEKEIYRAVPHYGFLLTGGGRSVLVTGDCAVASPELTAALGGEAVDVALLDFPWLALPRGRQYVRQTLRPAHIALTHFPLPKDDTAGYRGAARRAVSLFPDTDVRLLADFLQQERF
ncbi:MAG: MBL fold metallo-hydrolase [Oscillospiraceae bacterium]|nr:MBL fold metallo-hydrolase [Oscillospiraceae bacterium]